MKERGEHERARRGSVSSAECKALPLLHAPLPWRESREFKLSKLRREWRVTRAWGVARYHSAYSCSLLLRPAWGLWLSPTLRVRALYRWQRRHCTLRTHERNGAPLEASATHRSSPNMAMGVRANAGSTNRAGDDRAGGDPEERIRGTIGACRKAQRASWERDGRVGERAGRAMRARMEAGGAHRARDGSGSGGSKSTTGARRERGWRGREV